MQRRMRLEGQLSRLERVPDDPKPVEHHISHLVDAHTCAVNPRHRHRMVRTVCCSLSYAFMHDRPSLFSSCEAEESTCAAVLSESRLSFRILCV